jgi:hypothetical protein
VGLYVNEHPTHYNAVRTQDIEQDQYGGNILTTLENLANSGPLPIPAGAVLSLRNESLYPIIATPVTLFAVNLLPHAVTIAEENLEYAVQ